MPDDLAEVEKHILATTGANNFNHQELRGYIEAIGPGGARFLDKLKQAVKPAAGNEEGWKRELQQLYALVEASGKSARQIMEEAIAGKQKWQQACTPMLEAARKDANPDQALGVLLDALAACKDMPIRLQLLQGLYGCRFATGQGRTSKALSFNIAINAERWRRVLADRTPFEMPPLSSDFTLGDQVALLLETVYGDLGFQGQDSPLVLLGTKALTAFRARAEARLQGKAGADLPKLPDGAEVTADRKKAILSALQGSALDASLSYLANLSLSELLVLAKESTPVVNAKFLSLANRVADTRVDGVDSKTADRIRAWKGKQLTGEMVTDLIAACRDAAKNGKTVTAAVERNSGAEGMIIRFSVNEKRPADSGVFTRHGAPGVLVQVVNSEGFCSNHWPLTQQDEESGQRNERFESGLTQLLKGETSVFSCATISIVGTPQKNEKDETETPEPVTGVPGLD